MANQTPYSPRTNFSDINQADPARLDVELAEIKNALDSTQGLLGAVLRDDGNLKDGLVQLYTLSDVVRKLLSTQVTPKGNWDAGIGYGLGDLVNQGDDSFISTGTHVSSSDFDADREAGRWVVWSRALQLATGVVLGTAAERNVGLGTDDVPDMELADARFYRKGQGAVYHETAAGSHVIQPRGGSAKYAGDFTGAVEIKFPQTWKNAHFRIIVDIVLEGNDSNKKSHSLSIILSGKTDAAGQAWSDIQAHVIDGEKPEQVLPVRYGVGPEAVPRIWLGDLAAVWANPSVKIRELLVAGAQTAAAYWVDGWSVKFVSAFEGAVQQQLTSAGVSQLPDFSSSGGKYVRVRADGLGLEYRTNLQVASDLNLPGEAPQDGDGYLRQNGGWLPISSYTFTLDSSEVNGSFGVNGGIGSGAMTVSADSDQAGDETAGYYWTWYGASYQWGMEGNPDGGITLHNAGVDHVTYNTDGSTDFDGGVTALTFSGTSVQVAGQEVYHPGNKPSATDLVNVVTTNTAQTVGGAKTFSEAAAFSQGAVSSGDLVALAGTNGGHNVQTGNGPDWAMPIWGIGAAYRGTGAGSSFAPGAMYGFAWSRVGHAIHNANIGEGLYLYVNGVLQAGFGSSGAYAGGVRIPRTTVSSSAPSGGVDGDVWYQV